MRGRIYAGCGPTAAALAAARQSYCSSSDLFKITISNQFVFSKFLFTDKKKVYSVFQCNKEELIDEAEKQLKEGYGTIIYMFPLFAGEAGHYVCIYKSQVGIQIVDLQNMHVIVTDNLHRYLKHYESFLIPTEEISKGGRTRRNRRKN